MVKEAINAKEAKRPALLKLGKMSIMLIRISTIGTAQATTKFKFPIRGDFASVDANDFIVSNLLAAVYIKSIMNK